MLRILAVLLMAGTSLYSQDQVANGNSNQPVSFHSVAYLLGGDLQTLWRGYQAGEQDLATRELSVLVPTNVPAALDAEICSAFASSQSVHLALFLGVCESAESITLLNRALTNTSTTVREAAMMALARRGDLTCEAMFILRFTSHPMSTNIAFVLNNLESVGFAVHPLLYIGSAACVAALFDSVPPRMYDSGGTRISFINVSEMRTYLVAARIETPGVTTSDEEMCVWWRKNRAGIMEKLKARDPKTLPRLQVRGIIIGTS